MSLTTSQKQVKFFCFARFQNCKIIHQVVNESNNTDLYKAEAQKVLNQLQTIKLQQEERQKINTSFGPWFCTQDGKEIVYLMLASQDYPERHIYDMAKQLQKEFEKLGDYQQEEDSSLRINSKEKMNELFKKYNNLSSWDKLSSTQEEVNEISLVVEKSINKTLENQQNLEKITEKSENMSEQAKTFEKTSKQLERIMFYRKLKVNIICCLLISGILAYFLVPIIRKIIKK